MEASLFAKDDAELLSVNARFQWIYRPGSDLLTVFNKNRDAPDLSKRTTRDRRVTVKQTQWFQI